LKTLNMSGSFRGALLTLTAVCALFAFGCAANSVSTDGLGGGGNTPQVAAAFSVCDASGSSCQTSNPVISASTATDITLAVDWTNAPAGTHTQEIRMLLPDGNFYQRFDASFLPSNGQASIKRMVAIQGTPIRERLLTGTWKIQVLMDDQVVNVENLQVNP
jgi:hypothetical protein